MEFIVGKEALSKGLEFFDGIVSKSATVPVLNYILVDAHGPDTVHFVGTDLDISLSCEIEARVVRQGRACISARRLFDIARLESDAPVSLIAESPEQILLKCARFTLSLQARSPAEFPEIPKPRTQLFTFPSDVLSAFIDRTLFATTTEESRYTLSGGKFIIDSSGALMVGTDGHRLAYIHKKQVTVKVSGDGLNVLIPRRTLSEVSKIIARRPGELRLGADENFIFFEAGPRLLSSRTLAGQFPEYEAVLPKAFDRSFTCDNRKLSKVIRRVVMLADERSNAIRFHVQPGILMVSSSSIDKETASEYLDVEYHGAEFTLGFNARYLLEFMDQFGSVPIRFDFNDASPQVQVRLVNDPEFDCRYLIMPMRL